ncbi:urease accessory protein UreF [Vulcanococcus limneticus Candia 3F8]|uniref:urease accessory protein UreF n=1 Tax=Vulcanococcus limneticus TaxID=2170428 RepID=UPI000B984411|nr:urease accessory UreF family protein [Vulcanococcus limneticus]MCP9791186.1 urease accessory protein UreF [Vulcanococcus limneticus MW73D5]MCP9893508.1 urease accessory protein UreF [Vulcanococcus limneticus Candia 3F8]MCP9896584.1 urease accessory protein UreF [Vulcanococcus limneticus Candia 3B3]
MADAARLRLFQLVSPALPVGGFSYSEGLEVLVQAGRLGDAAALRGWLEAELRRGAVAIEAAALAPLAAALRHWREAEGGEQAGDLERAAAGRRELVELDGWLLAQREAAELRAQQLQMGQSLLQLLTDLGWPLPGSGMPLAARAGSTRVQALAWPAAFAWAGLCLELASPALEQAYLYGWVANQISAAVRLVPLGPTDGQRLQLALAPLIAERAASLAAADPRDLWSGGVGAGLAQLQHAELYSRLFRS